MVHDSWFMIYGSDTWFMECFDPAPCEDLAIAQNVHCSLTDPRHWGDVEHLSIKVLIVKHAEAKCKCLTSIWKTKWRWQHNKAHHDICNVNGDDNNDKHDNHHDTAASSASPHRRLSGHDRVLKQPVVNTQHNLFSPCHQIYVII